MKKVALFGGAFDPPHVGHALCITNILNASIVDEVWIVPTGDSRYDKRAQVGAVDRRKLVELFVEDYFFANPRVKISTVQIDKPAEECATIDLYDELKNANKDCQFLVAIGSDNLPQLQTWRSYQRLIEEVPFIVYHRLGHEHPEPAGGTFIALPKETSAHCDISSSLIRSMLKESKLMAGILGAKTEEYLRLNHLYSA